MTSSDSEEISDKESPNDQIFEPQNETTSKCLSKNLTNALSLKQNEENILEEFNVEKLYDMATKGEFPKKMFIFGQDKSRYTQRLHFFTSIRTFSERPKSHVSFTCKICSKILRATFPEFNNLNNHLKTHDTWRKKWLSFYNKHFAPALSLLDNNTYDMIRFIISSNLAICQLDNVHFQKLIENKMTSPCLKTFRYDRLPTIYQQMLDIIDDKLNKARTICLITDIWTNRIYADFLALGAVIINEFFEQELIVIGMKSMGGDHTAENIQTVLETIINSFKCNKTKFHGN